MVQIDVPLAFGIGGMFASAGHRQLQHRFLESRANIWLQANLYFVFFYSWPPIYFLERYFGWETSHMWWHVDAMTDAAWLAPALLAATAAALNAGFLVGAHLVHRGRLGANRLVSAATVVFYAGWILAMGSRTANLGTYAEWASGTAPRALDDPAFVRTLVILPGISFGALAILLVRLRLAGRRAALPSYEGQPVQHDERARG